MTALDYSAIETAIAAVLKADASLTALVATASIEAGLRSDVQEDVRLTFGFGQASLPAICVTVRDKLGDSVNSDNETYGEIENAIPIAIFIIDQKSTEAKAFDSVIPIREHVERIVKEEYLDGTDWELDCITQIPSMKTGLSRVANGSKGFICIAEVLFDILKVTS